MVLHPLAAGESESAVGQFARDVVKTKPLFTRQRAPGNGRSHHVDMLEIFAGLSACAPYFTVVLGVDAVKLDQNLPGVGEQLCVVSQTLSEVASQVVAVLLDPLDICHGMTLQPKPDYFYRE